MFETNLSFSCVYFEQERQQFYYVSGRAPPEVFDMFRSIMNPFSWSMPWINFGGVEILFGEEDIP